MKSPIREDKARHHCIKVNHTEDTVGMGIEEYVVHFRVEVIGTSGKLVLGR